MPHAQLSTESRPRASVRVLVALAWLLSKAATLGGQAAPQAGSDGILVPVATLGIAVDQYRTGSVPEARLHVTRLNDALGRRGYPVSALTNPTRTSMLEALRSFRDRLPPNAAAFVLFSGMALQYMGQPYLLPTDARLEFERDIPAEGVPLADVLEITRGRPSATLVVAISAPRRNPFIARTWTSASNDLTLEKLPPGVVLILPPQGTPALDAPSIGLQLAAVVARTPADAPLVVPGAFQSALEATAAAVTHSIARPVSIAPRRNFTANLPQSGLYRYDVLYEGRGNRRGFRPDAAGVVDLGKVRSRFELDIRTWLSVTVRQDLLARRIEQVFAVDSIRILHAKEMNELPDTVQIRHARLRVTYDTTGRLIGQSFEGTGARNDVERALWEHASSLRPTLIHEVQPWRDTLAFRPGTRDAIWRVRTRSVRAAARGPAQGPVLFEEVVQSWTVNPEYRLTAEGETALAPEGTVRSVKASYRIEVQGQPALGSSGSWKYELVSRPAQ